MKKSYFNRKKFLKTLGLGSVSAIAAGLLPIETRAAIDRTESMKVTKIEGIRFSENINIGGGSGGGQMELNFFGFACILIAELAGIGETYPFSNGELGALKDYSIRIMGKDPRDIDGIWQSFYHDMAMRNAGGADMRILSAINMAQMDILGKSTGLPLYRLIGGKRGLKLKYIIPQQIIGQ